MYKILIYVVIVVAMTCCSVVKIKNNKVKCINAIYLIKKTTYLWHFIGLFMCLILFSLILYADITKQINKYLPSIIFLGLLGIMTGICLYSIVMFMFTPVGIYENGVLNHFLFMPYETIEAFKIEHHNMLNIGNNMTIVYKIVDNETYHPSIEIRAKDEKEIRKIMSENSIKEVIFVSNK